MDGIVRDIERHRWEIKSLRNQPLTLMAIYRIAILEKEIKRLKMILFEPKKEAGA